MLFLSLRIDYAFSLFTIEHVADGNLTQHEMPRYEQGGSVLPSGAPGDSGVLKRCVVLNSTGVETAERHGSMKAPLTEKGERV